MSFVSVIRLPPLGVSGKINDLWLKKKSHLHHDIMTQLFIGLSGFSKKKMADFSAINEIIGLPCLQIPYRSDKIINNDKINSIKDDPNLDHTDLKGLIVHPPMGVGPKSKNGVVIETYLLSKRDNGQLYYGIEDGSYLSHKPSAYLELRLAFGEDKPRTFIRGCSRREELMKIFKT